MPQEPSTAPENEVDIEQTNVGRDNMAGQGEWPDPDTPPTGPSDESAGRERGGPPEDASMLKDAQEADPVAGGSSSIGDPPDD